MSTRTSILGLCLRVVRKRKLQNARIGPFVSKVKTWVPCKEVWLTVRLFHGFCKMKIYFRKFQLNDTFYPRLQAFLKKQRLVFLLKMRQLKVMQVSCSFYSTQSTALSPCLSFTPLIPYICLYNEQRMPYANFAAMNRTMNNAQMADAKIGMIYALQNLSRTVLILTIPKRSW